MRRWLDLGVSGFRLSAIPYLCEREETNNENLPETHAIIKKIRAELDFTHPANSSLPKPISGRKTSAPISVTATSATWPITLP